MAEVWHASRWMAAIYASDLPTLARFIATVYADFAGDRRDAWCTNDELARRTGASKRAVQQNRARLVAEGWLVAAKGAKHHSATVYLLAIPEESVSTGVQEVHPSASTEAHQVHPSLSTGVHLVRVRGAADAPKRSREITTLSSPSTSPGPRNLASSVAALTGLAEDDERLTRIPDLLKAHKVQRPTSWLQRVVEQDGAQRLVDLLEEQPGPRQPVTRRRCPDHPIGYLTGTEQCQHCAAETREGTRPAHMNGKHLNRKENAA